MTATEFKEKFPAFINVDDAIVTAQIEECETLLNSNLFGVKYPIVLGLAVAHELSLSQNPTAGTAPIVSRSIERGSITYATTEQTAESLYYSSTPYGKKLFIILENNKNIFAGAICD